MQNSYCLGEAGIKVAKEPVAIISEIQTEHSKESDPDSASSSSSDSEDTKKKHKNKKKNKKKKLKEKKKMKKEENKLQKALTAEEENQKRAEHLLSVDERKRPYNSMYEVKKPTDEEMEAYFLKRRREEDPMNQFM